MRDDNAGAAIRQRGEESMRIINVWESNMWKTGVPACHGKQASRLLLQPRQTGKPVCHDSRDGLSSGSTKKIQKAKKSLTISRKTITRGASQILNQQSTAIL
jgi:hypothetical protein